MSAFDDLMEVRYDGLALPEERPPLLSQECLEGRHDDCPKFIPLLKDGPLEPCEDACHGFVYDLPCGC